MAFHEPREPEQPVSAGRDAESPAARRSELQDVLNARLYHPLSLRLARRLAETRITPDQVSVAGGLCVIAAGLAYAAPGGQGSGWPLAPLGGLLLHMTWHVLDGADGDLARITGRTSPMGEIVDGLCDYLGHIVLYILLAIFLAAQTGAWGWWLAIAAGLSRIVQANYYETQRRLYQWRVYGTPWIGSARPMGSAGGPQSRRTAVSWLVSCYLCLADSMVSPMDRTDAALRAAARDPARLERTRQSVRDALLGSVRQSAMLGANWRTIFLGLSMLAGSPLYYFVFEAALLNLALALAMLRQREAARRLEAFFGGEAERAAR